MASSKCRYAGNSTNDPGYLWRHTHCSRGSACKFFARDIVEDYSGLINGVIVGEGEETLYQLVRSVEEGGTIDPTVPGFMSRQEDGEIIYIPRNVTLEMDSLPFMSHKGVWPEVRPKKGDIIPSVAAIDTVRGGCPTDCGHCLEANSLGKHGREKRAFHSPEYLVEQLKRYLSEGKTYIVIQDSFYANGDGPIAEFIERVCKENIRTDAMHFFIEPGYVSSDIFKVLEKFPADKVAIDYGIETGSEKVAKNMNRFFKMDSIYRDIEALGKTNTLATAWWLISLPGETEEDVRLTEEAIKIQLTWEYLPKGFLKCCFSLRANCTKNGICMILMHTFIIIMILKFFLRLNVGKMVFTLNL